jgi:3-hydroxyacyl-CoA dehydrogenase
MRVGLVPAWGGCTRLLQRLATAEGQVRGPVAPALRAFEMIAGARTSTSALDARALSLLGAGDGIVMNRDRLLAQAKTRALALAADYRTPAPVQFALAGPSGASAMRNILDAQAEAGQLAPHDRVVGNMLAELLSGGSGADPTLPVDESVLLGLEREAFLELVSSKPSRDRIRHMIDTGRALSN